MLNKYKLLKSDKLQLGDKTLYRIKALRSFGELSLRAAPTSFSICSSL
jgi:hypothetical protein